ncbi:MAG: hypothetical protein Q8M79_01060 [Dehalococcoidia bacterium]|nr:hypothetical protein [Dehalococcoidia bacterium]
MTYWSDRLASIDAESQLVSLKTVLSRVDMAAMTAEQRAIVVDLVELVDSVRARLVATDPKFVTEQTQKAIEAAATEARSEFEAFKANQDETNLHNTRTQVENLLRIAATGGLVMLPDGAVERISRAAARFRDASRKQVRELDAKTREITAHQKQIDEALTASSEAFATTALAVRSELEDARAGFTTELQNLQQQAEGLRTGSSAHLDEVNASMSAVGATLESRAAGITEQIEQSFSAIESRFTDGEVDRERRFGEEEKKRQTAADARLQAIRASAVELATTTRDAINTLMAELEEIRGEARETLGLTGAASTFGAYSAEATRQRGAADRWRRISVGALIAALTLATWAFFENHVPARAGFWEFLAVYTPRTAMLAVTLGAATYAARQSARHRQREESATRLANELSTFHPFIAALPPEEQTSLRRWMTQRLFRGQSAGGDIRPGESDEEFVIRDPTHGLLDPRSE